LCTFLAVHVVTRVKLVNLKINSLNIADCVLLVKASHINGKGEARERNTHLDRALSV
jgi:hypothetical protein